MQLTKFWGFYLEITTWNRNSDIVINEAKYNRLDLESMENEFPMKISERNV
jgi:hypothetical protein